MRATGRQQHSFVSDSASIQVKHERLIADGAAGRVEAILPNRGHARPRASGRNSAAGRSNQSAGVDPMGIRGAAESSTPRRQRSKDGPD